MKRKNGFTLIELLVVISIIGLLSSVVLASTADARSKAENAKKREVVRQFEIAFQIFHQNNGKYPPTTTFACLGRYNVTAVLSGCTATSGGEFYSGIINNRLVPSYMSAQPSLRAISYNGGNLRGIRYRCVIPSATPPYVTDGSNNTCAGYEIQFWMQGSDADCKYPDTQLTGIAGSNPPTYICTKVVLN